MKTSFNEVEKKTEKKREKKNARSRARRCHFEILRKEEKRVTNLAFQVAEVTFSFDSFSFFQRQVTRNRIYVLTSISERVKRLDVRAALFSSSPSSANGKVKRLVLSFLSIIFDLEEYLRSLFVDPIEIDEERRRREEKKRC